MTSGQSEREQRWRAAWASDYERLTPDDHSTPACMALADAEADARVEAATTELRAEVERLRRQRDDAITSADRYSGRQLAAEAARDAAVARLAALDKTLRELHTTSPNDTALVLGERTQTCVACAMAAPCPTIRALDSVNAGPLSDSSMALDTEGQG